MSNAYKSMQVALISKNIETFKNTASSVDINAVSESTKMNILHYYVYQSSELSYNPKQVIEFMVSQRGLRINEQDEEGLTAVYHSVVNKRRDILQVLIDLNADIELPDHSGNTPLFRAVSDFNGEKKLLEIIFLLLNNNAKIDRKNSHGVSAKDVIIMVGRAVDAKLNPKECDLRAPLKDFLST